PPTRLAPSQAASMTPTSRPPVNTTQPHWAMNSPRTLALSRSRFEALADPITPTANRIIPATVRFLSLKPRGREGHVRMLPCLLPLLFHRIRFAVFPLSTEALHEPKLSPAVPRILR